MYLRATTYGEGLAITNVCYRTDYDGCRDQTVTGNLDSTGSGQRRAKDNARLERVELLIFVLCDQDVR